MNIFRACCAMVCAAWLSGQAAAQACGPTGCNGVQVEGETVRLIGPINAEVARDFERATQGQALRRLEVDSGGGDVEAGMAMARIVAAMGLEITVLRRCMSSCANYLFLAARQRHIAPGAVVAWHGTASHLLYLHRTGARLLGQAELAYTQHLATQEVDFFRAHRIDGFIAWVGKLEPFSARNFYILSPQDMALLGAPVATVRPDYIDSDLSWLVLNGEVAAEPVRLNAAEVARLRAQVCAVVDCP